MATSKIIYNNNHLDKCENDLNDPNAEECFNAKEPKPNEVKDLQTKHNLLRPEQILLAVKELNRQRHSHIS